MIATKKNLLEGDTVIFLCDEYRRGEKSAFDGQIQFVNDETVSVIYLSGYKSRNDDIPYEDILAKVDKSKPWVELEVNYSGHFQVFKD